MPKMAKFAQNAQNCPELSKLPKFAQNCPDLPKIGILIYLPKNSERFLFLGHPVVLGSWGVSRKRRCVAFALFLMEIVTLTRVTLVASTGPVYSTAQPFCSVHEYSQSSFLFSSSSLSSSEKLKKKNQLSLPNRDNIFRSGSLRLTAHQAQMRMFCVWFANVM